MAGRPQLHVDLLNLRAAIKLQPLNLVVEPRPAVSEVRSILSGDERTELFKILAGLPARERPGSEIDDLADIVKPRRGAT